MQIQINHPAVIAELTRCHEVYEKALIDNDAGALDALFGILEHAVRFGATENLHGADAIRAFRQARPKINLAREIRRLDILALGDSVGIINLEFIRPVNGVERNGRQTQFWFRFAEGWRIASAHVSLLPASAAAADTTYVQAVSAEIGLNVRAEDYAGVNENLSRIAAIAGFLMQFPLSQDVEAAPVFQP